MSCLHLAVISDNQQIVKYIIQKGANINAIDENLYTSLMLACKQKLDKVVEILIDQ